MSSTYRVPPVDVGAHSEPLSSTPPSARQHGELQFPGSPKNRSGPLRCRPKRFYPRKLKFFRPLKELSLATSQARITEVSRGRLQRAICSRENPPYSVGFFRFALCEKLRDLRRYAVAISAGPVAGQCLHGAIRPVRPCQRLLTKPDITVTLKMYRL